MASAKIIAGKVNAKGLVVLYIKVVKGKQKAYIPIKDLKVHATYFKEGTFINKKEPDVVNVSLTNALLKSYELKAAQKINALAEQNLIAAMDVKALANAVSLACFSATSDKNITFGSYTDTLVVQMLEANQFGNAGCYNSAKCFLIKRLGGDIPFNQLTYAALKKMETSFYKDGFSKNGLSYNLRTIRAIYYRACKEKKASLEFNPFMEYSIEHEPTVKRAIGVDDIKKIKALVFSNRKPEFHAHNYFMFSFYNRGMNFKDMALLKVSNINEGRITYRRAKTGQLFDIEITKQVQDILDIYTVDKGEDQFIFPIIKRDTPKLQHADIVSQRRFYDELLVRIATEAKLDSKIHLSSYVARHSWASAAQKSGVNIGLISQGLGHSDMKTTEIYLAGFDKSVVDIAGQAVADLLN
jgi:integrase/recombinase XerD